MREIQASDAKAHLAQLLSDVERGETIVITRHGRPIARLVPEADGRRGEVDRAFEMLGQVAERSGGISAAELVSARHEGHKY